MRKLKCSCGTEFEITPKDTSYRYVKNKRTGKDVRKERIAHCPNCDRGVLVNAKREKVSSK